ncbi:hypothetical protein REPUB_Repub13aG0225500 [Reevesia pubescens]
MYSHGIYMISGYISTRFLEEAKSIFDRMPVKDVVSWNAMITALGQGEWILAYIDKNGIGINCFVATEIVDMFSKCGNIDKALNLYRNASRKDIITWNSIIVGSGMHNALEIFSEMLVRGVEPNEATFVGVLSACSRAVFLNEGRHMFQLMVDDYGNQPAIEHYGFMVDLLGRV